MIKTAQRWLGIDFSGNYRQWAPSRAHSNIWIAIIEKTNHLKLANLLKVQELHGNGSPFERLISLLQECTFQAAAIDAPFSIPAQFFRNGNHSDLLNTIGNISHPGRLFPKGHEFISAIAGQEPPLHPPKPLRQTEKIWSAKGIAVRSTLWNGPRPGAPMTAACMKLLSQAHRPIWPWATNKNGLLAEAFPAAQLYVWGNPNKGYNGNTFEAREKRKEIYELISKLLKVSKFENQLIANADALDAVICAFAAKAVTDDSIYSVPMAESISEGWISVHK